MIGRLFNGNGTQKEIRSAHRNLYGRRYSCRQRCFLPYIYAAPYSSFDLAPYKYLGCIQVQYKSLYYLGLSGIHAYQNIDLSFVDIGDMVSSRSDLEKYCPDLIPHIAN